MNTNTSITGIIGVHGSRFDAGVVRAGDATEQPAGELKLPGGSRVGLLAELPIAKNLEDREELKVLMSEAFFLDEKIKNFVLARFAEQTSDREAQLESAKLDVREQQNVLRNLEKKLAEDNQEFVRLNNARIVAQNAAREADVTVRSLSPFASRQEKEIAAKRLRVATQKAEAAENEAGGFGDGLNIFKRATVPQENEKLKALAEKVQELECLLDGRDPVLARFGFTQH